MEPKTIIQNGRKFFLDPYSHGSVNGVPLDRAMFPTQEDLDKHVAQWHTRRRN